MKSLTIALLLAGSAIFLNCSRDKSKFENVGYWEKDMERFYAVYAADTTDANMLAFGEDQIYTPGKFMQVYFFDKRDATPDLRSLNFDSIFDIGDYIKNQDYADHHIAEFRRFVDGDILFIRYPIKSEE